MADSRGRAAGLADALTFLVLTVLVWGLHPFARGVRVAGDDVNFLYVAWLRASEPLAQALLAKYPPDGWTRALAFWPFVLATHSPRPVAFLQLFYGAAWLLNGLAIARLAGALLPGSRLAPLVAGCLMVTATSDFLTGSVVYAPHLLGIALFFLGATHLVRSVEPAAGLGRAAASAALLAWSFFTVEYTYPAVPFLALLVWLHARRRWTPRCWRAMAALIVAFAPPAVVLARDLLGRTSRAAAVLLPDCSLPPHCSFSEWLPLFLRHVAHNVWPWSWAFRSIPPWYDNYPAAFPPAVFMGAAAAGAALVFWRFRRGAEASRTGTTPRPFLFALVAFAAMVTVNVTSASLGGDYFVRSHFVSRGWASLAIAVLLAELGLAQRWRMVAGIGFAGFVFLGVWGGVERQSYLLGYAVNERRELASLLDAVPAFAPPGRLVLIQPPGSPSLIVVNNPNLVPFVYGDPSLWLYRVTAPHSAFERSTIEGDAEGRIRIAVAPGGEESRVDPSTCILVFYSVSQRRFVRLDRLPAGLLRGSETFFAAYRPERWLRQRSHPSPPAIADFLAEGGTSFDVRALGKSRRYTRELARTPSATMLSVAPALAEQVQADSLAPYVVELEGGRPLVWLGSGPAQGYSSMLWARAPLTATLRLDVRPGPGRAAPERHLVVRVIGAGAERQVTRQFATGTTLDVHVELAAGLNVLEMWLEDVPDTAAGGAGPDAGRIGRLGQMRLDSN